MNDEPESTCLRGPLPGMRRLLRREMETAPNEAAQTDMHGKRRPSKKKRDSADAQEIIRKLAPYPFQEG